MIAVVNRREAWIGLSSRPETDCERALVGWAHLQRERNGALFGVHGGVRSKRAWHCRHC